MKHTTFAGISLAALIVTAFAARASDQSPVEHPMNPPPAHEKQAPAVEKNLKDRKSTRLNSSHEWISYAVFCLKKKRKRHSVTVFFFSLQHLCRQQMPSSEDNDRDCRTDQTTAKDSDPCEIPESALREPACEHR